MIYTILKILIRPDVAYLIKDGCVISYDGRNSDTHIEDIEAVCRIHKVYDGIILGRWTGDHYRITLFGNLKAAKVPLSNVIN